MSPLGQAISGWLKTKPGVFKGNTPEEALSAAYEYARAGGWLGEREAPRFTLVQFSEHLNIVGYVPRERARFGNNAGSHWSVNLPEA